MKKEQDTEKLIKITTIDDWVMFIFIGAFIFDKLLPGELYLITGLIFIMYYFFKILISSEISVNKAILWQLIFIVLSIVSLSYSREIMFNILYTLLATGGIIFAFSQYFSRKRQNTYNIIKIIKYFVFWSSLFTIYVIVTQWNTFSGGGRLGTRALGDEYGGATGFSYYSIIISIILIWFSFYTKRYKWLYIIITIFSMFLNAMTGGRKAILIPLMFFIIYGFLINRQRTLKLIIYIGASTLLLILLIKISLDIPLIYNVLGYRIESFLNTFINTANTDMMTENSDQYRFSLIKEGLEIFLNKPIFGYGLGNSRIAYENFGLGYMHAHNNYIEMLLSGGLILFVSWYWIYIYLISYIWRYTKSYSNRSLAYFFISLLVVNLISDVGATMYNVLHFNLFVGLAAIYVSIIKKSENINVKEEKYDR